VGLAEDVEAVVAGHVAADAVPGAAWWVGRDGEVARGAAGAHTPAGDEPVRPDTLFRIASTTKPVVAAAALTLVDEGRLGLDDPVDGVLPELAGRQVLADPADAAAGTVPAARAITVRDVLTSRLGLGMDFTAPWPTPTLAALAAAGLPAGPPAPQAAPAPAAGSARTGRRRARTEVAGSTTPPTASGRARRRSPTEATAWSPPSTTWPRSRG
jgi:CubicO group peptidase (beta-lactamase class C family)